MYSAFKQVSFFKRINSENFILSIKNHKFIQEYRCASGLLNRDVLPKEQVPADYFFNHIKSRQEEALLSAIFKVGNNDSWKKIYDLTCNCGKLIKMYKFEINSLKYVLIEMENEEQLSNLINYCESQKKGNFSILNSLGGHFGFFQDTLYKSKAVTENYPDIINGNLKGKSIRKTLKGFKSLDLENQLILLYDTYKLDDLGFRLRYMMWKQIQNLVNVVLPTHCVYPFGSAANGLGDITSDLDLVILQQNENTIFRWHKNFEVDNNSIQDNLNLMTNIISKLTVGCTKVCFIKNAKVPIIKYKHSFTGVDCDVSMHQNDALKMSQLLFTFSNFDNRIKPLIFFIKIWARELQLTREHPGPTITNFSLILLTIFFLQQKGSTHTEILPPFEIFPRDSEEVYSDEKLELILNNFKCNVPPNDKSIEEILLLFFKFYSVFNFNIHGCCLNTGQIIRKNSFKYCGMYIKNPYCSLYNVSKNVSISEVKKFQFYCQVAATLLESESKSRTSNDESFLLDILNVNLYANELSTRNTVFKKNNVKFADLKNIF